MHSVASVDGLLTTLAEARLPVSDRAFLYGDAVFEALRTFHGKPDALERHLSRLAHSAGVLGITLPVSQQQLASEVQAAVHAVHAQERYIRIVLSRGDAPASLAPRGAGTARRVIIVRPLELASAGHNARGIRMITQVSEPSRLWAGAKPTAYLTNLLAVGAAQADGADDALLVGSSGQLLEGATSSVFVVKQGAVLTPPLSLGILPGITRERLMAAAQRAGIETRESLLTVHDAYRAQELLVTSSVRGIVPVVAVDGIPIGTGQLGPVCASLQKAYAAQLPPA